MHAKLQVQLRGKMVYLISGFIGITIILYLYLNRVYTQPILGLDKKHLPDSIASLEKILIGGKEQSICIRGNNINNPILLFVHGGPGDAAMPLMIGINPDLEKDFIVVNWDQRGAGKSFYPFKESDSLDYSTFVSDANELTEILLDRFNKKKIFIVGHSWGSVIATFAVQQHPERYYAYIGIGQVVNMKENERISYNYTLKEAANRQDKQAIEVLTRNGNDYYDQSDWLSRLLTQRKYLLKYGGAVYQNTSYRIFEKYFLSSPEYSIMDVINRVRGSKQSLTYLWPKLMGVDLTKSAIEFKVPVYFLEGVHDYNAPTNLVEEYFQMINAPQKEIFWFDQSAHFPQWEEPQKFHKVLREILDRLK